MRFRRRKLTPRERIERALAEMLERDTHAKSPRLQIVDMHSSVAIGSDLHRPFTIELTALVREIGQPPPPAVLPPEPPASFPPSREARTWIGPGHEVAGGGRMGVAYDPDVRSEPL